MASGSMTKGSSSFPCVGSVAKRMKFETMPEAALSTFEPFSKDKFPLDEIESEAKQMNQVSSSDMESNRCGICLSEGGKTIRGWINSCNHYFCFVCIMEWSKIESRCPMCKQRFSSIRRPAKGDVFAFERVVEVPLRDQVCNFFGNTTVGPSDPYADTRCSVCDGSSDDNLLLLCDLCDSASHTYCVGLGTTVPDGDWFCDDCTRSQNEHNANIDTDTLGENTNCMETSATRESSHSQEDTSHAEIKVPVAKQNTNMADTDTRTLHRCREVHARIQALRDNWRSLQTGSLSFPSSSSVNVVSRPKNHKHSVEAKKIEKAWKMMELAKSMQPMPSDQSSGSSTLKNPKRSLLREHQGLNGHIGRIVKRERSGSANLSPPRSVKPDQIRHAKNEASSSSPSHILENHKTSERGGNDGAKSEIKSLVRLNLKLLNKEKQLGAEAFKQVARRSTHIVLATCGLEKSTLLPRSVCHHVSRNELKRSSLMPSSCRKCFYAFVESTVSGVMFDILNM